MSATEYKNKGNEAFSAKAFPEAIEYFTRAIELDGLNHVLYSNRSAAHASLSHYDKALEDAKRCVELNPTWVKGYIRLGAAHHGLRHYDEAIKTYKEGLALEADNETLKGSLEAVEADKKAAAPQDPFGKFFGPDTMAKIQANPRLRPFLSQPDYVKAINAIVANPSTMQMFIKDQRIMTTFLELAGVDVEKTKKASAADSKAEEGDDAQGGEESDDEETTSPPKPAPKPAPKAAGAGGSGFALKEEGNAFYKLRKFDEALAKYNAAIAVEPTNTTYRLNRTAVYFEKGEYEACLKECDESIDHGRQHKTDYTTVAKLMTRKASCLQKMGQHGEAIALFKKSLLEWRNADTLKKLEECEKEKKQLDEQAYLDTGLALKEKEEGNALFKADKFPEAIVKYTESIKRNPKDHTVYSNRAAAYLKLAAYDDAIKDCDTCIALNPTFVKAHSRRGAAYYWLKQYHRSTQSYEEGLKIDPENAECKEGLDRTRSKIFETAHSEGDEDAARRAMADPEIQGILGDSYMQLVLSEMQKDPRRLQEYLRDPSISAKLNKLIAAGVVRFGSGPSDKGEKKTTGSGRR